MILAGDVGGTSARLALFEIRDGLLVALAEESYPSRGFADLASIVSAFLAKQEEHPERACFGIAGPVRGGRVRTPNLPWVVDAGELARATGIGQVALINDLEANAHGIAMLGPEDFLNIQQGDPDPVGNQAVMSAGTGLGEAGLIWDGGRHRPFACEGGHCDLAPRDALEAELLACLRTRFGHVSYERVLSGPGLLGIFRFFVESGRGTPAAEVIAAMRDQDPPGVVAQAALRGQCEVCRQALDRFVSFYGAEAGNLALKLMATGGVFVGGGIAPRIAPAMTAGGFLEAFLDKGRMRPILEAMPLRIILNPGTALLGAARCAASLSRSIDIANLAHEP